MSTLYFISCRWKYSLALRLMILLFLVNTFASACTSDSTTDGENDMPRERETTVEADTTSTRRNAAPTTVSLLGNPFVANRSKGNFLSSYYDRINTDFTIDADPIENIHRSTVTDTIFTIRFGNSMMEFYAPSQTGDLLLQVADIKNSDITLRNNMRVGMSQAELMSKLKTFGKDIRITQNPNEVIASGYEGAPTTLHFFLKNGKVSRILYEGYVD
ncbi:hypothetical protein [Pontibacter cellulosilyticus]|uniref:DUF4251 domain-containing protein n=1 Tax=Pontibacter cellulosilyticus TaxID=1720253 RepID=A0A923N6Q9_9BACT|nr:hypothetical protein [Pontibacter cellulosilyticus]MBC5993199.1 hypothetical protein [Pontibacter cellulosilyticus]